MSPKTFDLTGKRVFVTGHRGMVGSALVRALDARGDVQIMTAGRDAFDLRDQAATFGWIENNRPDVIIVAAATVGGIVANSSRPAEFIYDNLAIETNLIEGARRGGVPRCVFLGSSCIYPKLSHQPMSEDQLLTGPLEPTNQWYAIAKIAGIKMVQAYREQYGLDYISVMPTNLYGPGDNFNLQSAHVIPALMRKAHEARRAGAGQMEVWGSGKVRREFLFVDDLAEAVLFLTETYDSSEHINVGTGVDVTIAEIARLVCETVGFAGDLVYDTSKPDGTPRKLMDVTRINGLGWTASTDLKDGLRRAYDWYLTESEKQNVRS